MNSRSLALVLSAALAVVLAACAWTSGQPGARESHSPGVAVLPQRVTSTPSPSAAPSTITATPVPPVLPSAAATSADPTTPPPPATPSAPRDLRLQSSDESGFTVAWTPGDGPAAAYVVRVDGQPVARATAPTATVSWPGGTGSALVQVSAVSPDGVEGPAAALVVVRPAAEPSPRPMPSAPSAPPAEPTIAPTMPTPTPSAPAQPSAPPTRGTQPTQPAVTAGQPTSARS